MDVSRVPSHPRAGEFCLGLTKRLLWGFGVSRALAMANPCGTRGNVITPSSPHSYLLNRERKVT